MSKARAGQSDHEEVTERAALRRVAGLSTELEDVSLVEYRQVRLERVILVGVWSGESWDSAERSMRELARLAETAGSEVLDGLVQRRSKPDPATFIGAGRAASIRDLVRELGADTVIVDGELSAGQLRRLEEEVGVKVVDRTWLILDIFAQHARSREGKAQVALAQLEYLLPRLRGWGEAMSRPGGGIGTRGPGETKIETDRRRIRTRIARLRREIDAMSVARGETQKSRRRRNVPAVVIVGYTNAGKSSLLNRLTSANVLVHDQLFATLDPAVRRCRGPSGRGFTIADTVGFVSHLPHQLVDAFRSTMEEVAAADLLLHVVDGSTPDAVEEAAAVRGVLREIGADGIPIITVINKADIASAAAIGAVLDRDNRASIVSATAGTGLDALIARIESALPIPSAEVDLLIPLDRGDLVCRAREEGSVEGVAYRADGIAIRGRVSPGLASKLRQAAIRDANSTN